MNKRQENMEDSPLIKVYMIVLPVTALAMILIYLLVRVVSQIAGPDKLVLNVEYHDYEQGAVLKTPMRAAADGEFEQEFAYVKQKKSGFMDELIFWESEENRKEDAAENGTYTFTYEYREIPDIIYVKSPEWWYTVDTEGSMMIPAQVGEETDPVTDYGSFRITKIETAKITTGIFNVEVTVSAAVDAVPSRMKLVMGGYVFEEWDGGSEIIYDREHGFASRTAVFRYNKDAREDISDLFGDAGLVIQEYTVRKVYRDSEIRSNVDGLQIVAIEK